MMKRVTYFLAILLLAINSFAQGHFVVAFSGNGQDHMNITVINAIIGGVDIEAGDEIGVFDGSICCGKVILTAPIVISTTSSFAAIAASREDIGLSNGYVVGNVITYKFWDSSRNKEISGISAEYLNSEDGSTLTAPVFTINETSFVKLSAPANQTPTSNAGPDQSVNEGDHVILDGSLSSDFDGDLLTYMWTSPSGITLSSATNQKPTFSAPEVTADTDFIFSLVVNDGTIDSPADLVTITVKQANKVPAANAGDDQSVLKGTLVMLSGSASSDPDGDPLTYQWTAPSGITLSSATSEKPTFTAPNVIAETDYTFSLVVNDGAANSITDEVVITVKPVNLSPLANAGPDQAVNEGTIVTLDGSASSDPDSDPLTYQWAAPSGITLSSATNQKPTFTAPEVSSDTDFTFSLIVNDGTVDSSSDEVIITVKHVNKAPTANAGADHSVNEGATATLDGSASSDPDGDALTYKWTAPTGIILSLDTDQKPTFTAPEVSSDTDFTFSLIVNDGKADSPADEVVITVKQVNKVPTANAGADQSVNEGATATHDGSASSDPDSDVLTYKWTAPAGITLSSATNQKPTFTAPEVSSDTDFTFSLIVNDGKADSPADEVVITVKHVNKAPTANSGADHSVNEGVTATLDGSASSDPDGDTLTYKWTAPTGIILSSDTDEKPIFTATEVIADTQYTFSLVVNDGLVDSSPDKVVITVLQVNKVPTANAGADQSVNEGATATLDGSASSDPDSDVLTYKWTAPAGIILSLDTDQKPTFTAPEVSSDTDFTFSLIVNDGKADSPADEVVITVKHVNKAPTANSGADHSVNEGATATLDGSASSDPDGDALSYKWTAPAGITLSSTTVDKPTFTAPEVFADTQYTFSLVVNDRQADSPADEVVITVLQVNKVPTANAGSDESVNEGATATLDGSASSDPDSDVLTYKWTAPAGIILSLDTDQKSTFTAPEVSSDTDFTFSLIVNDGKADSPADGVVVTVFQVNKAPVADAGSNQTSTQKQIITLNGSLSSDPDNDAITFHWMVPAGITLINPNTSNPSFETPIVLSDTDFTIRLKVNDGQLDSQEDEVIVHVFSNQFPIVNAGADFSVNEGSIVTLDGSASSDPEGKALKYIWTGPPGFALMDQNTSSPSFWAPEVALDHQYLFTLVVNDGTNDSSPDYIVVTVTQVNKAPVAKAGANQSIDEGSMVKLDGSMSSDHDNNHLTYRWIAPDSITLSSNTVSRPTFSAPEVMEDTDFAISLVVNDGTENSTASQVIVTVKQVNRPPVANAGNDLSFNEGQVVTIDATASVDPDNDALTYLWTAPDGITSTTIGKFTFTAPEVKTDTKITLSLVVNDGFVNSTVDQVVITIKHVNKSPVSKAGADQLVNELVLVTLNGTASTDPDNETLTYLWNAPNGITLSSTTAAKPTFIAPEASGTTNYTFSLLVNDGQADSPADEVVISVMNVDHAPYLIDPIKNVSVDKRAADQIIDLKTIFADDDFGDVLIYSITSNTNDQVVKATITGSDLKLSFSKVNIGSSEIVISTSSNGKEVKSKFEVEVKIPTGTSPIIIEQNLLVYPNPTSGKIKVVFNQMPKTDILMTITNVNGIPVFKKLIQNKEEYIDLSGNLPGVYLIKTNSDNIKVHKIIIQ